MTSWEQSLLFGATVIVLVGTLVAIVVQYVQRSRRDKGQD